MKKNILFSLFLLLIFLSCSKDENEIQVVLPTISTTSITSITFTTAISGGNISNNGGSDIIAKGICWSTSPNPTIANSKTVDGIGLGIFNSNITGLVEGTTYYVRAYATNEIGTVYGDEKSFSTIIESMYFPPLASEYWETIIAKTKFP